MDQDKKKEHISFEKIASIVALIFSVASIVISILTYNFYLSQAYYEKKIQGQRFIINTLRDMNEIQEELQKIRSKISGKDNLSEKEILLLNYYEVLSKILAENKNVEPSLFTWAKCTHNASVKLRKKPSVKCSGSR